MSQIKDMPELNWTEEARREIKLSGKELLRQCDVAYRIGDLAVVGLFYTSYTAPPWMIFALAEGITVTDLLDFRRLALLIPPGTQTAIRSDFKDGLRFAKLYGFTDTGHRYTFGDDTFSLFRRK